MGGPITVLIAEALPLIRRGLAPALSEDPKIEIVMSSGRTDKEIAGQLSVTEATVKSHIRTVFHKTGTVNRAQAVATAMRVGLIR